MVGFVAAFEVCMCRNPVGFLGLSGFICFFRTCQFKAFCVYVRMGIREEKCKTPLILPFLGSYLSFHL